jgi:hypothetical protein
MEMRVASRARNCAKIVKIQHRHPHIKCTKLAAIAVTPHEAIAKTFLAIAAILNHKLTPTRNASVCRFRQQQN